jgi:hypothetical protein
MAGVEYRKINALFITRQRTIQGERRNPRPAYFAGVFDAGYV